jgi:hypothetical protein
VLDDFIELQLPPEHTEHEFMAQSTIDVLQILAFRRQKD